MERRTDGKHERNGLDGEQHGEWNGSDRNGKGNKSNGAGRRTEQEGTDQICLTLGYSFYNVHCTMYVLKLSISKFNSLKRIHYTLDIRHNTQCDTTV